MDIADWLRKLVGLFVYGPGSLGTVAKPTAARRDVPLQASAEFRRLSVIFCGLVTPAAPTAGLDPADLRDIADAYHRAIADVVERFEELVVQSMLDAVLIYSSFPRTPEADAERAVRAGLSLIDAVDRRNVKSFKLQARIGIATGKVAVGGLFGEHAAQARSVVGEAVHIAARLQSMADRGGVVIAGDTQRLVGDLFEYRNLGAIPLKGRTEPLMAWQVLSPKGCGAPVLQEQRPGS